LRIKSVYVIAT